MQIILKALLVGDVHITDDSRRPSSRAPGYEQQILDKLTFCVEEANKRSAPIVQLGDMFHLKSGAKNTHRLVQRVHEVLRETDEGVWVVPGNHDIVGDRLDSLSSQPLGALSRMSGIELLIGETVDLPGIAGVPYITEFDGGNWQYALSQWSKETNGYGNFDILAETPTLLCTHAPIFPPGQAPGVYASIDPDAWADYWCGIVATAYGHIHSPAGVFMDSKGTMQFANFGAISRGSLHEETVNRKIQISYWNESTFEPINVPSASPDEVFLFAESIAKKANQASAKEFAAAIGQVSLSQLTLESVYASLRSEGTSKDVMSIIQTVLEEVQ